MSKRLIAIVGVTALVLSLAVLANGQVRRVTTIQNPDGTYTIVEYPVGRETIVNLNPVGLSGATGRATILRDSSGTTIKLRLTSLPPDVTSMNVYAVDPSGAMTLLGPMDINNGFGTFTTMTPLSRFMLVTAPETSLSVYNERTHVYFRSDVPSGLTVIPVAVNTGEPVAAVIPSGDYVVPMLGIPAFRPGHESKLRIDFSGAMEGAHADIFIKPRKHDNATEVLMHFHDLREAPKGTAYILWAVSPDNQYQRMGEIVNVRGRNEAQIQSETTFDDFGLLMTTEDLGLTRGTIIRPGGHRVGVIQIVR